MHFKITSTTIVHIDVEKSSFIWSWEPEKKGMISEAYTLYLSKISKEEMSEFKEIILGYTSTRKLDDVINEGYETEELNSIDLEEDKQNQLNSSSDLDLFDDINLSGINKKIKKSDQPSEYIVKGEVSSEEDSIDDISEEEEIKTKILDDFHSLFDDNKTSAIDFNFHTDKEASTLYYSNKIHTIPRVDFPENNLHGTNTWFVESNNVSFFDNLGLKNKSI